MNPQDKLPSISKSSGKSPFVDFKGHIINILQIRLIFKRHNSFSPDGENKNPYELIIEFGGDVKIKFVYAEEAGRDRDFESIKDVLSYHAC